MLHLDMTNQAVSRLRLWGRDQNSKEEISLAEMPEKHNNMDTFLLPLTHTIATKTTNNKVYMCKRVYESVHVNG